MPFCLFLKGWDVRWTRASDARTVSCLTRRTGETKQAKIALSSVSHSKISLGMITIMPGLRLSDQLNFFVLSFVAEPLIVNLILCTCPSISQKTKNRPFNHCLWTWTKWLGMKRKSKLKTLDTTNHHSSSIVILFTYLFQWPNFKSISICKFSYQIHQNKWTKQYFITSYLIIWVPFLQQLGERKKIWLFQLPFKPHWFPA